MKIWRHSKLMGLTMLIAVGCSTAESTLDYASQLPGLKSIIPGCTPISQQHTKKFNWNNARTIDVRIRQGEFSPMIIGLTKDRPYVLRIRNADDTNRNFKAGEFFRSVALSRVAINGKEKKANCITGVTVKPNQVAELELVAVRDGRYEFEDGYLSFFRGTAGVIHINLPAAPIIQKARFPIRPVEFQPSVRPAPPADDGPGVPPAVPTTPVTPDLPGLPDLPELPALPTQESNSTWKLPSGPS